jgi:hypothetical protein
MCCVANENDGGGRGIPACLFTLFRSFIFRLWLPLAAFAVLAGGAETTNGPTIHLCDGARKPSPNSVADFMYFVPLISLQPVSSLASPGSTQSARIVSTKRHSSTRSFTATSEVEVTGDGWQRNIFDLDAFVRAHERQLQKEGSSVRHLKSIDVQGAGAITVEVEGTVSNGVPTVCEVRLRFNAHGHSSPVSIDLCEIRRLHGGNQPVNEILARVNTLTFRRQSGPPTMEIGIASVKRKDAGDGFWQNFKGRLVGAAANMLLDPLKVDPVGQQAMLDFGLAIVSDAPTFTFPRARNLETNGAP